MTQSGQSSMKSGLGPLPSSMERASSPSMESRISSLTVSPNLESKVVYYKISDDGDAPKMARYSELASLHEKILKEVPTFQGVFPPKRWRNTRFEVIETRRVMIEEWFLCCISDERVKATSAFIAFWGSPKERTESNVEVEKSMNLDSTIVCAVKAKAQSKEESLEAVQDKQAAAEDQLTQGQNTIKSQIEEVEKLAAIEQTAVDKLFAHHTSIEELKTDMLAKKGSHLAMAQAKEAECKRLEESLAAARQSTKKAQESLMATQTKRTQVAANNKAKKIKAAEIFSALNVAHTGATAEFNSAKRTLVAITDDVITQQQAARTAQIKREECENTLSRVQKELNAAEADRKRISDKMMAVEAAKVKFSNESVTRKVSLENELKWAKEKETHATALRDMSSRELLTEGDCQALSDVKKIMSVTVEAASKSVSEATTKLEQTTADDAEKPKVMQADYDKLAKDLQILEGQCSKLISRFTNQEEELEGAKMTCAASDEAVRLLLEFQQSTKSRIEGPLKAAVDDCAAKLQAGKQSIADLRKTGDAELEQARYAEEAESVASKQAEAAEAKLEQALAAARPLCALPLEDNDAALSVGDKLRVLPGVALKTSLKEYYKEEDVGCVTSIAKGDSGVEQVYISWERSASSSTMMRSKWQASFKLEAKASRLEAMSLLEAESVVLAKCINTHEIKEASLTENSSKLAADWENQKIALEEEVLRAKLQTKAVDKEVSTLNQFTADQRSQKK